MNVKEALEKVAPHSLVEDSGTLAPIIERALDAVIDKILRQGIPEDVRAVWHDIFVAAMMEEK